MKIKYSFSEYLSLKKSSSFLGSSYWSQARALGTVQTPYRCFAPGPHWGTFVPQTLNLVSPTTALHHKFIHKYHPGRRLA